MTFYDLIQKNKRREDDLLRKDVDYCAQILFEYLHETNDYASVPMLNISMLNNLYANITNESNKRILLELLDKHNYNYNFSIHGSIYYGLCKKEQLRSPINEPISFPGVNRYSISKDNHIFETINGKIKVKQADKLFANDKAFQIFQKQLPNHCYSRSLEFLELHPEYQAVVKYMPNQLVGGHYHAFLQNGDEVLDIAANAFYESKKYADIVLRGETIIEMGYDEVLEKAKKINEEIKESKDLPKLHLLALYYDKF